MSDNIRKIEHLPYIILVRFSFCSEQLEAFKHVIALAYGNTANCVKCWGNTDIILKLKPR